MSRYEPVPEQVTTMIDEVKDTKFMELAGSQIMTIFDTDKKMTGGRLVIARIKKMNDELKFFAMDDMGITYDYAIFIDKQVWDVLDDRDRERIIFHELCHCEVDFGKKNPYGIKDHEIQGFYAEAEYNADDERWSERVGLVAQSVHDPEAETPVPEGEQEVQKYGGVAQR